MPILHRWNYEVLNEHRSVLLPTDILITRCITVLKTPPTSYRTKFFINVNLVQTIPYYNTQTHAEIKLHLR